MTLNKLISYSLYGSNPKYLNGAVMNSLLAREFFPEWHTRFYCGVDTPKSILKKLEKLGSQVSIQHNSWHPNGMFWRYLASDDTCYERIMFRDVDSRFTYRDVDAIKHWIESKRDFHIIRDHPYHMTRILGGLFSSNNPSKLSNLLIEKGREFGTRIGEDQRFLSKYVYPNLDMSNVLVHDRFFCFEKETFRLEIDKNFAFMGEPYDEFDNHAPELREVLKRYSESRLNGLFLKTRSYFISKFSI